MRSQWMCVVGCAWKLHAAGARASSCISASPPPLNPRLACLKILHHPSCPNGNCIGTDICNKLTFAGEEVGRASRDPSDIT
ncbi:hypothetical protein BJV74DRAFT_119284 [Russula compacta]|nr:hypothetical protein BJV74DRAFT_119284 [Russula compacta]